MPALTMRTTRCCCCCRRWCCRSRCCCRWSCCWSCGPGCGPSSPARATHRQHTGQMANCLQCMLCITHVNLKLPKWTALLCSSTTMHTGVGDRLRRGGVGDRPRERPPPLPCGGGELRLLRSALRRLGGGGDLIGVPGTRSHRCSMGCCHGRPFGNPADLALCITEWSTTAASWGHLHQYILWSSCTCAAGCSAASSGWASGGACPCPQGAGHHDCDRPGRGHPAC